MHTQLMSLLRPLFALWTKHREREAAGPTSIRSARVVFVERSRS
jgi:low temperature requirement protein LtrA